MSKEYNMKEIREDGIARGQKNQKRGHSMEGRLEADMEFKFTQTFVFHKTRTLETALFIPVLLFHQC